MTKTIMKRPELEGKYVKNKTSEKWKSCKKQIKFCSKLYKKERKKYYERLHLNNVADNKKFWKTVKPFLSDKVTIFPKTSLVENDEIISDESKVANLFSNFFENAIEYSNDDDDDDDDDKLFLWYGWPTKGVYALFPAGTIVRDSHHRKSPTRREQGLNLHRTWVQTLLNQVVQ